MLVLVGSQFWIVHGVDIVLEGFLRVWNWRFVALRICLLCSFLDYYIYRLEFSSTSTSGSGLLLFLAFFHGLSAAMDCIDLDLKRVWSGLLGGYYLGV